MTTKVRQIKDKTAAPIAKTLEDLSVIELKAIVYDRIGIIEQCNSRIKTESDEIAKINSIISKKSQ